MVVRAGATSVSSVIESKEHLEATGTSLVGAILNYAVDGESSHLRHEGYGPSKGIWTWRAKKSQPDSVMDPEAEITGQFRLPLKMAAESAPREYTFGEDRF